MLKTGKIIRQISNLYTIDIDGEKLDCAARGKFRKDKISPTVGDYVEVNIEEKIIEKILERKNYLDRPVVANVDVALIVTSLKKPDISFNLLDKLLSIVITKKIEPVICFTKLDLACKDEIKEYKRIRKYYESLGFICLTNKDKRRIKKVLKNKVVVITGQTGAGKSTLLNNLDKSLNLETKPISEALNRGVHTTRHVEIFNIGKVYFVDTPGFSSIDFDGITLDELKESFPEFQRYRCEFKDCTHTTEKKCRIRDAYKNKKILDTRYENYLKFERLIYESQSKLYK